MSLTPEMNTDPENAPRPLRRLLILGLISLLAVTTTVAANVTLNNGKKIEFGQGIYKITACDQFVTIYLTPSPATYNANGTRGSSMSGGSGSGGFSNVQNIRIAGLDPVACKGTTIRIKLYDSGGNILQIYTDSSFTVCSAPLSSCGFAQMVAVINSVPQSDPANDITLVNQNGVNIGYFDSNQLIDYNATNAQYSIAFTRPTAPMASVSSLTLESAPNV